MNYRVRDKLKCDGVDKSKYDDEKECKNKYYNIEVKNSNCYLT